MAILKGEISIKDMALFQDIVQLLKELAEDDWTIGERIAAIMSKHNEQFDYESTKPYYYEIGKPVMFKLDGVWHKAEIIKDYRTMDGIINVLLEDGRKAHCGELRHEEFVRQVNLKHKIEKIEEK